MFKKITPLKYLHALITWVSNSPWRYFPLLFAISFAVHYNTIRQIPAQYMVPTNRYELESIAIALLETGEFANPYIIPTGPTAHLPPIYPFLYFLIYRLFGLTSAAGYISLGFMCFNGAVLAGLLPWLSGKLGLGRQAGFIGGLGAAFFAEWAGHGEYLTGLAMALILLAFLRRWTRPETSWQRTLLLGLGIGFAFHIQPALLTVILGLLLFEHWHQRERPQWLSQGILLLGILIACLPWGWRNYTAFDAIFFIRSNFGLELRMGNYDNAAATFEVMDAAGTNYMHPADYYPETRLLKEIGEIEYMRRAQAEALDWIRANPARFLSLTLQRFANLWFGPLHRPEGMLGVSAFTLLALWGLWRAWPILTTTQRAAIIVPLLTYPLVHYIVGYMPRYRVPIDWILYALAGFALHRLISPPTSTP